MCQPIYISSEKELPEIEWNENSPGFYVIRVEHKGTLEMLEPILKSPFVYEALSHMGCSCGLCYDEDFRNKKDENYENRVKDVKDFVKYLDKHKKENRLKVFSSQWDEFPDKYPVKNFRPSDIDDTEFYIDDMTILNVV